MLELGACMEKEKSSELGENRDDDFAEISFEELLAQEKKDSFWLVSFFSFFRSIFSLVCFGSLFSPSWRGRVGFNSPITTFFVFVQAKKWEIKTKLKLITLLAWLTVTS